SHLPTSTLFPYTTLFRSPSTSLFQAVNRRTRLNQLQLARGVRQKGGHNFFLATRECSLGRRRDLPRVAFAGIGKRKFLRWKTSRSEEHTSELQSPDHLVC